MGPLKGPDPPVLGRFRLLGRIGAGGMGVVYLGRDPDGQVAAVKVIRHELADDPGFRDRFLRELQACFRVSGACTVRLLDFDVAGDPPWLATEYVDAPNLEQLVRVGGPLGTDAQLALALGLADALTTLHAKGITHRDLKPSNVLCPDDGVKVIDFGIAAAEDSRSLTGTSQVIGTPAWMAPERFTGRKATPASDMFAWAGLVSFAASGWVPFSGDSAKVMFSILRGEPDVDYGLLAAPLPELVTAAFSLDPALRPTAGQVREALSAAVCAESDGGGDGVSGQLTRLLPAGWDGDAAAPQSMPAEPSGPKVLKEAGGSSRDFTTDRPVPGDELLERTTPSGAPQEPPVRPAGALVDADATVQDAPSSELAGPTPPAPASPDPPPGGPGGPGGQRLASEPAPRSRRRQALLALVALLVVAGGGGLALALSGGRGSNTPRVSASPKVSVSVPSSASASPSTSVAAATTKVACGGKPQTPVPATRSFTAEPKLTIDTRAAYTMTITSSCGPITIALDAAKAPHTVNLLAFLAADRFYDGTFCHRSTSDPTLTVLQCGDPTGTGAGQIGFTIAEENLTGATYLRGTLAMAKTSAAHSTSSQFFLVDRDSTLPPDYTVAGHITKGLDVLDKLLAVGNDGSNGTNDGAPKLKIFLERVTVTKG